MQQARLRRKSERRDVFGFCGCVSCSRIAQPRGRGESNDPGVETRPNPSVERWHWRRDLVDCGRGDQS
jgi:hypothetical protein